MSYTRGKQRSRKGPGFFAEFSVANFTGAPPSALASPVVRYGFAIVVLALSLAVSVWLAPFSYTTPFLFLYPAVLVAAWFGGVGPGLLVTVMASLGANYFLMPPHNHLSVDPESIVKTVFFCLTLASICWVAERARMRVRSRTDDLQQALRESDAELGAERARWKEVVEGIADEVWVCDADGRMSLVNLPTITHMGLEEFKDKSVQQVLDTVEILNSDGEQRPAEDAPLLRALRGETLRGEEIMTHRATRVRRWRQFSAAPIRDAAGAIVGSVAVVRDITAQKEAEQQLHVQAAALRSAANAIVITDREGIILWVNPAFTELTGYAAEDVMGRTPRLLRSAEHDPQFYSEMWKTILAGEVWRGEVVNRRKNGTKYLEEMTITPVRSDSGHISHFIAIKVDVTERRQTEQALIRNEKLAATGRLAATIAHEINNPLTAMTNLLYLIGPSVTDAPAREYFDLLKNQLQAVTRIANRTLKFHREHSEPTEFKVSELLAEVLELYQPNAKQHGVTLLKRIDAEGNMVGHAGEIRQLISNLLLNAIEATRRDGKVTVHLYEGRNWQDRAVRGYRISIADNGSGIDREHRARIFEPFFTTKGEKGTGLGLWVSIGLVERAGGFMRVWSTCRAGRSGTCFSIFLPGNGPATKVRGLRDYQNLISGTRDARNALSA